MEISGKMLIGAETVFGSGPAIRSFDPKLERAIEPEFGGATADDVDTACRLAEEAFETYGSSSLETRASFLDMIAKNLDDLDDGFADRAASETGLPVARIKGETQRTAFQMRLFADVVRSGRWLDATIDSADAERKPTPRPDIRMQKVPVGPVVVFGASNFPILYSVAGGDTASALAAGCPVIVKAHSSHLGTSELVGKAIQNAVRESGLHPGVFALVYGHDNTVGEALVDHPLVQAVGFTGSEAGGMALVRRGAQRPNPIPVFAEMTSTNPNFVLPAKLAGGATEFAKTFVQQMTAGVGQMCLKPGMIVAIDGEGYEELRSALKDALSAQKAETMLSPGIHGNFTRAVEKTRPKGDAAQFAKGQEPTGKFEASAEIFEIRAEELFRRPDLADEMFGPAAVLVRCGTETNMLEVARSLKGQLTVALHVEESDQFLARRILPIVTRKAGRILANKFSNMVEISYASVHGGPFPAASDSRFTSVGATAIERFLRPICYDNMPAALLPPALQDSNPLGVWRLRDGSLMQA